MPLARKLSLIVLAAALSGCVIKMEADLSLKALFEREVAATVAKLWTDVEDCESADEISEARRQIDTVFDRAFYKGCEDDGLSGVLEFHIPFHFDRTDDDRYSNHTISFYQKGKDVGIHWPKRMDDKVIESEQEGRHTITLTLNVRNDTGTPVWLKFQSVKIGETEHDATLQELAAGTTLQIQLTPARIDTLRKEGKIVFMTRQ